MDILIQNGRAHELFPDGAPELHEDLVVVRDYVGEVQAGWAWDGVAFSAPATQRRGRSAVKSAIDLAAGITRERFITTVPGQESTYQLKAEEANAYIAANRPADTTAYPMLSAEAEGRGMTASDLADEILATRSVWIQAAAQIEKARVSGKAAVDAAPESSDFDAVAKPFIETLATMQPA